MKKIISLILLAIMTATLCSCSKAQNDENYLGGKGELSWDNGVLYDDTCFYTVSLPINKFNRQTKTFSVACQVPGCDHYEPHNPDCRAIPVRYWVFNGDLIKIVNEPYTDSVDGSTKYNGYIYLCEENKQLFKNFYPDSFTDEQRYTYRCAINYIEPLGNDFLAVESPGFMYILDKDYNVKYTALDMGAWSEGVYYYNGEIYYISELYLLMKLDMETGEAAAVDLNSMKITEGVLHGDTLWFVNGDQLLCSYDFKTGEIEVKDKLPNALTPHIAGRYLTYTNPSYSLLEPSEMHLYDLETGEDRKYELDNADSIWLYYVDGEYYSYDSGSKSIIHYNTEITEILDVYVLTD